MNSTKKLGNVVMENVRITFRNFSGKEGKFNRAGNRNFSVIIEDPIQAHKLMADGWNVKVRPPRDEGEAERYYLQISVSYNIMPPHVYMVTRKGKTALDENTISALDYADISNVDLTFRPYNWEVNGKTGVKAYLKTMYVTIEEDELAAKYAEEEHPEDDLPF